MALRKIRTDEDPILRKRSKEIKKIDRSIHTLLDDMYETMVENDGIGIAAVQVGILKRAIIVCVNEEKHELINPEILHTEGAQSDYEGCLSVPGKRGMVERPALVRVRAQNRHGETFELEGTERTAVALMHEIDHLNGVLYLDRATEMLNNKDDEE